MNLGATQIDLERDKEHSMVNITIYKKSLTELIYEPINTKEHELYIGFNHIEHLKVNLKLISAPINWRRERKRQKQIITDDTNKFNT